MRKIVASVAVALMAACGGGGSDGGSESEAVTDYSPAFVGTWQGSSVVVFNGESINSPGAYTRIVRTGTNAVVMMDVCGDGSGPAATVTSANSYTTVAINCPAVAVEGCSSVTLSMSKGGTGSLSNGQLQATLSGAATGCGYSYPISITFTGTRSSTSTAALNADGAEEMPAGALGGVAPGFAGITF